MSSVASFSLDSSASTAVSNYAAAVLRPCWQTPNSSPTFFAACIAMTGWSTSNPPWVTLRRCCVISAATPTASRFPIHRLLSFDGERVTFRWKDYAYGSKQKKMTLTATEFLRRFFLHVLPKGFVRIRYFGFLANRWRTRMLALARQLLGAEPMVAAISERVPLPSALWRCPRCGARMVILRRFTPEELRRLFFDSS